MVPPPPLDPPPFLPFQCLRQTAKILLSRLRCQKDLSLPNFGPPSAGTIGGTQGGGVSQPNPPSPHSPPSNTSLLPVIREGGWGATDWKTGSKGC